MYGYYPYGFDWTYLLVAIGAVISLIASARVNATFSKYSRKPTLTGMTGAEAAQKILQYNGIFDVQVQHVKGNLTDHYDPRNKTLNLSDSVYGCQSVAAVGVAAHECGHAIQHKENYGPLALRSALVPAANIGSKLGIPIILIGVLLSYNYIMIQIGIWVFAIAVLFQVVTLPVEFNASRRAVRCLDDYRILQGDEVKGCRKVLKAAALTYVAAAASAILQLLRLMILFGRRRND